VTSGTVARCAPRSRSTAAVTSSGVPAGMSTTTWNSDLLSNGSIFSTTSFTPASDAEAAMSARIVTKRPRRQPAEAMNGPRTRRDTRSRRPDSAAWCCLPKNFSASHGVTVKAMASEISIPMLALIGIGLM